MLAEHDAVGGHAHRLRRHDLVAERVRENPVLVYARLVREGVATDDGLVRLHAEADGLGEQLARRVNLFGAHSAREGQAVWAHVQRHDDLFERGVAGALADAVDSALDLARARAERREAVGDGEAEVVVAVHADGHVAPGDDALAHGLHQLDELAGRRVADRVGDVERARARLDRGGEDLAKIVNVAARRVLGGELHVVGERAREAHGVTRHPKDFGARLLELVFEVYVGGGDEGVQAGRGRPAARLPRGEYVGLGRAAERGHTRLAALRGHGPNGREVAVRRDGEPGLDHVHAEALELSREANLLLQVHRAAGRLLAVAQRRVEYLDAFGVGHGCRLEGNDILEDGGGYFVLSVRE